MYKRTLRSVQEGNVHPTDSAKHVLYPNQLVREHSFSKNDKLSSTRRMPSVLMLHESLCESVTTLVVSRLSRINEERTV